VILLLLRHAKSSWVSGALDDHERPLNGRGKRDAPRMGALLHQLKLVPDRIISSDAVRARMTAEAVAAVAGYAGEILLEPRLYLASPDDIVGVLRTCPSASARTVMIVGHNPGLHDLITGLTGEEHDFPTAALAHVSCPIGSWQDLAADRSGALVGIWRPKELE
jgi:phosphohistidine phosphatase